MGLRQGSDVSKDTGYVGSGGRPWLSRRTSDPGETLADGPDDLALPRWVVMLSRLIDEAREERMRPEKMRLETRSLDE
jgi:hypothetical protein